MRSVLLGLLCVMLGQLGQVPPGVVMGSPVGSSVKCADFCVERLTEQEIHDLKAADAKLTEATNEYKAEVEKIQQAHGQTYSNMMCLPYDTVEIRGSYALIQYNDGNCIANAVVLTK